MGLRVGDGMMWSRKSGVKETGTGGRGFCGPAPYAATAAARADAASLGEPIASLLLQSMKGSSASLNGLLGSL